MNRIAKLVSAILLLAWSMLPPPAAAQLQPPAFDIRGAFLEAYGKEYKEQLMPVSQDLISIATFLDSRKTTEALAVLDRMIAGLDQQAGATGVDPKNRPGLLKKNLSLPQKIQMTLALYIRGVVHMIELDPDLALLDLESAVALPSQPFAEILAARGDCLSFMEEYDRAVADYSSALRTRAASSAPEVRSYIYRKRATTYWSMKKDGQALADFDEAIRLTPKNGALYEDKIKLLDSRNDGRGAIEVVSRLIRLWPDDLELYFDRASRYETLPDLEQALKEYAGILALTDSKETKARALERRATIYEVLVSEGQDRNAEAEAEYTALLDLEPDSAHWHGSRGRVRERREDYRGAIADYDRCIKLVPGKAWPILSRGGAYLDLGDYSQAVKDFDQALKLDPESLEARYWRGLAKAGQKDYKGAIADFDAVLKKAPKNGEYFEARGKTAWALGEREKAMKDFDAAVELNPKDPYFLNIRGGYYRQLRQYEKALADYDKALEIDPGNIDAVVGKADVFFFQGDYQNALPNYTVYLKRFPKNALGFYRRGECYSSLGKDAEAVADFRKAIELEPEQGDALNALAWLLATSPERFIRNGSMAVDYAKKSLELAGGSEPNVMDTLAAALAAAGRFEEAVEMERKAIALLPPDFSPEERANFQARLELYLQGRPFIEKR